MCVCSRYLSLADIGLSKGHVLPLSAIHALRYCLRPLLRATCLPELQIRKIVEEFQKVPGDLEHGSTAADWHVMINMPAGKGLPRHTCAG